MRYFLLHLALLAPTLGFSQDLTPVDELVVMEEEVDLLVLADTEYGTTVLFYRARADGGDPLLATRSWCDSSMVLSLINGKYVLTWRDYWNCDRIVHAHMLSRVQADDAWWHVGGAWNNAARNMNDLKQP